MQNIKLMDRPKYMEALLKWMPQTDLVKIVTGVRRCGKSKLFDLFQKKIIEEYGIKKNQIITINLEDTVQTNKIGLVSNKNKILTPPDKLLNYVIEHMNKGEMNYIFLDEIQMLENWQQVANTLRLQDNTDVYLTGSNAHMFSSDLANTFGGRYVEIKVQPYSFDEYKNAFISKLRENNVEDIYQYSLQNIYEHYSIESGFPKTLDFNFDIEMIQRYLLDTVYQNTIQKDIIARFNVADTSKLDAIIKYMFDNIGNETSIRNIEKYFKSSHLPISAPTISTYIKGMLDSYLLYKCDRYDIKGKKYLESDSKYYVADLGLRHSLLGKKDVDLGHVLENIVYLELIRRGYKVFVGKINVFKENKNHSLEVDFVAEKAGGIKEYYQVALYALEPNVLQRELTPLQEIKDSYPKYLLSLDFGKGDTEGIKRINIFDWLLEN